jgi:hypothetical protein
VLQTSYILGKTFLPFVLAQNALRVVIQGIVYSHEIVFTQPMTSDNYFVAKLAYALIFKMADNCSNFLKFNQIFSATKRDKPAKI